MKNDYHIARPNLFIHPPRNDYPTMCERGQHAVALNPSQEEHKP